MSQKPFSLKAVVLEIVIVIIGITIAFWLSNWGDERQERELEQQFLLSLQSEMVSDSIAFFEQSKNNARIVENLNGFIQLCRQRDYKNDSVDFFIQNFLNRGNWLVNSNTFDILKSGGNLEVISDFDLRKEISAFYHIRDLQSDKVLEFIQAFLDDHMHPYLVQNTNIFISSNSSSDFIRDTEFQNLLVRWRDLNEFKLEVYTGIVSDLRVILRDIEKNLD